MYRLLHFKSTEGKDLFAQWLDGLKDKQTKVRIAARLIRLQSGNFGDCKPLRVGVWEQRIDWGPGFRVYYAIKDKNVILLCSGGEKKTQEADINIAIGRWKEWNKRGKT